MMTTPVSVGAAFLVPVIGTHLYVCNNWRTMLSWLVPPWSAWKDLALVMVMCLLWRMSRMSTKDFARHICNASAAASQTFNNHLPYPFITL